MVEVPTKAVLVSTVTLDEGLQLEFEGLVAGLDERLVEELLTGSVLLGSWAASWNGLCTLWLFQQGSKTGQNCRKELLPQCMIIMIDR